jgi:redox-sensitive bicupin YhaK (pirin superfamily)
MRFIQMWFIPEKPGLAPAVEQKEVEQSERTNRLLPLVSNDDPDALPIASDAKVYSCFLQRDNTVAYTFAAGYGGYLYVLEGGRVSADGQTLQPLDAALITREAELLIEAGQDAELLLVAVPLTE